MANDVRAGGCAVGCLGVLATMIGLPLFFLWDGYYPREIPREQQYQLSQSTAGITERGWVHFKNFPLPDGTQQVLSLSLHNQSEYILREIRISVSLIGKDGERLYSFEGECLTGGSPD